MAEQYEPRAALRLIFEFDEDGVRLVSEQPVEMAIGEAQSVLREPPRSGYYIDTRDAGDLTLSRTRVEGAFAGSMEVFPENPMEPITRVEAARRSGAFTVVVPASDVADHVTLINVAETAGPPDATARPADMAAAPRVVEVASFRLGRQR